MYTVLFVCTGNTCRSPMAEALFHKRLQEDGLDKQIYACSAGLAAEEGDCASEGARFVLLRNGIDLDGHKAKQVKKECIEHSDLVLAMTDSHKQMLLHLAPVMSNKIYTINEFIGGHGDVSDPYGGDEEVYTKCAEQMDVLLEKVLLRLKSQLI